MDNPRRSILDLYGSLAAQGRIERDPRQIAIVQKLDTLCKSIDNRGWRKNQAHWAGCSARGAPKRLRLKDFIYGDRSGAAKPC